MKSSRPLGLRNEVVRESNLATILQKLHLDGAHSRSDLVRHTGLTRGSIGGLVGDLADLGLVREERAEPDGSPGRPSVLVHAESSRNVVIAVEILVDSIAVSAVGLGGELVEIERTDRATGRTTPEQTVQDLADLYRRVIARLESQATIYAVGVAVPALVRHGDNVVVLAPNLGWENLALAPLLQDGFGLDVPVIVDNEAALAALAESRRGAARLKSDVLCLWGEVGIGGGMVSNGQLMRGASGFGTEVGHLPINLSGRQCGCGAIGCLETEVGERALLERSGRRPDGGRVALAELFVDAMAGDAASITALREQGRWLGIGLSGLVNLFDPDVVVLGGFLAEALPFLEDSMGVELEQRALKAIRGSLTVVPADCGGDAPLLGAGELAWDTVLADLSNRVEHRVSTTQAVKTAR